MLTEKQYKLLMFINKINKETGFCPSFEEMKEAVGLKSKSGIHALIEALEERGFIKKMPHKARAMEVLKLPKNKPSAIIEEEKKREVALQNSAAQIPLYGKISAGTPIEAIADENEFVSVPFDMVNRGQFYALTIEGESMIDAGIFDGDTVIIKKTETANNGDIIVAFIIDEGEATLKEFKKEGSDIILIPHNSRMKPMRFHASQVKIQGTLSGLMRIYH